MMTSDLHAKANARRDAVVKELETVGFCHLIENLNVSEFVEFANSLGTVWERESVRISEGSVRLFNSDAALPFHNDSAFANIVAWHCIQQCSANTPTLLLDVEGVWNALTVQDITYLSEIKYDLPSPGEQRIGLDGLQPMVHFISGRPRLNYVGWIPVQPPSAHHATALQRLKFYIARKVDQKIAISLKSGESLFLNNNRFLHARSHLPVGSSRHLERLWINTDGFSGIASATGCHIELS